MRTAILVIAAAAACAAAGLKATRGPTPSAADGSRVTDPPASCGPALPDLDGLGVGFDIVTGTGFSQPVVTFTYNRQGQWNHPYSGSVYCVPDEMHVLTNPGLTTESTFYASAAEVANSQAHSWGINLGLNVLGLSTEVSKAKSYLNGGASVYSRLQQDFAIFDAAFSVPPGELAITAEFNESVAGLPKTYDPTALSEFVATYGTHVVVRGTFGGQVTMRAAVDASFIKQNQAASANVNGQLQFHSGKGATIDGTLFSRSSASSSYNKATGGNFAVEYLGGNPDIGSSGNLTVWREWMESVKELPVRIGMRLVNVTEFVTDPIAKANIQKYIDSYLEAHGDIGGPVVPSVTTFPMGPCDCQVMGDKGSCPSGYFTVAMELHNKNPSAKGMVCCNFCDTYSPDPQHGFPPTFGSVSSDPTVDAAKGAEALRTARKLDGSPLKIAPIRTTGEECPLPSSSGSSRPSKLCVPGTAWIGTGVDMLTGKPVNFRVADLDYSQNGTWQNPFDNTTYALPDGVAVSRSSSQDAQLSSATFGSSSQYSHSIAHNLGFQADPEFGNGSSAFVSLGFNVQNSAHAFAGARGVVARGTGSISLFKLQLPPAYLVDPAAGFLAALDTLPSTYDENAYVEFIRRYGSHVVTSAVMGGEAVVDTYVDQVYYSGNDASDVGGNVLGTFSWFKLGGNWNGSSSSSFKDFQSSSASFVSLKGGDFDSTTIANDLYDAWVASVHNGPVPITLETARVSAFVKDATKSANLDKAIHSLIVKYNVTTPAVFGQLTKWASTFEASIKDSDRCYKHAPAALYGYSDTCSADDVFCKNEKCAVPAWTPQSSSGYAPPGSPVVERTTPVFVNSFDVNGGACPPGSYNIGWTQTYNGYFGYYDRYPIKCGQIAYNVTVNHNPSA